MGAYYYSTCHNCKVQTMWAKCPEETALIWHERFKKDHENHKTEVSHDYNEEFYEKIWKYEDIDARPYEDLEE